VRIIRVIPHGDAGFEVRQADCVDLVEERVDEAEAEGLRLGASGNRFDHAETLGAEFGVV
jgi:hypothetical protein